MLKWHRFIHILLEDIVFPLRTYTDPLQCKHVTTENQMISDRIYEELVHKMPIPCTDVVFTMRGRRTLCLTKRNVYPMKGVWVVGGRIFFNDLSPADSIARCVKRETGLVIDLSRFRYLATHYYQWHTVAQGEGGGKNVVLQFCCEINKTEFNTISKGLDKKEYVRNFGLQHFTRDRLIKERCHSMLLDLYNDIYST